MVICEIRIEEIPLFAPLIVKSSLFFTCSYVINVNADEVALFWGLDFYNDALLQAEETQVGSVTTEILLRKDMSSFTLSNGWAFPRRVYFNGENCEMPLPQIFPMLPNGYSNVKPCSSHLSVLLLIYLTYETLNFWS